MLKVEFQYQNSPYYIQATEQDKFREVCNKFAQKIKIDINNVYFLYSGSNANLEQNISQIINKLDQERKMMVIIVVDKISQLSNENIIKSPNIICPICHTSARFEINKYKIKIFNCKNDHVIDNILISEFESTQLIDESKIICGQCKAANKGDTYNNEMYICNKCNMNLCPLCKLNHDKNHDIIKYEQKNYICSKHNKEYNSYCEKCKEDICLFCEKEHKEHKITLYTEIIPENTDNKNLKFFKDVIIKQLKNKIEMLIDRLNNVMNNIKKYIKISEDIYNNYNMNNINYNILQNFNYNYQFITGDFYIYKDCRKITKDYNYKGFIPFILKIYNEMNKNEIDLIYNINNNQKNIKIFGENFVKVNKNLCKIIYNNKEYDLSEEFNCENIESNELRIKLKGINNVTSLSYIFSGCSTLSSLSNLSNLDTKYMLEMCTIFKDCQFVELPDISNLDTSNVIFMDGMFSGCSNLKKLPDISKWNTKNVLGMSIMFEGCKSLLSLPDISKWDISKAKTYELAPGLNGISGMFDGCNESLNIPEKFNSIN